MILWPLKPIWNYITAKLNNISLFAGCGPFKVFLKEFLLESRSYNFVYSDMNNFKIARSLTLIIFLIKSIK